MLEYNYKRKNTILFKGDRMIRIKLSDLLGKHKMTQKALAQQTNIRPATVSKMYYEEIKRIDVKHLDNICKVFNCEISELLEFIPDKNNDLISVCKESSKD